MRNQKMWVWEGDPIAQAAYKALGVSPIPLSVVDVMSSLQTGLVNGVYGAWAEGRLDDARRLQFTLARLHGSLAGTPYVGAVKHLLSKRGLPSGETRAPQALLTPAQAETVDRRLGSFEDLTRWLEPVVASPA